MQGFRVIEFQLLQSCNARCIYCAYDQGIPAHHDWLPLDVIDRTLAEERPEWVWFEGGEVTMTDRSRAYLLEAMAIAAGHGVKNRINTNADKLTPEWAERLAAGGLQFACISFDTLDPARFSTMRGYPEGYGEQGLARLKQNAMALADAGVTVDLEATVTKYNVDELESLYDFAESLATPGRDILMGAQFLVATYDQVFDLYPSLDRLEDGLQRLTARARRGRIPARICCSQLVPCKYEALYEPHPNVIWVPCSCGNDYVHVHATGDVHLCGFWDHTRPIGNLHQASLGEIWQTSDLRRQALTQAPAECRDCGHWDGPWRCHNACFSIAHRKSGTFAAFSYGLTSRALQHRALSRIETHE